MRFVGATVLLWGAVVTHYEAECERAARAVRRATGCTPEQAAWAVRNCGPNWVLCVQWLRTRL